MKNEGLCFFEMIDRYCLFMFIFNPLPLIKRDWLPVLIARIQHILQGNVIIQRFQKLCYFLWLNLTLYSCRLYKCHLQISVLLKMLLHVTFFMLHEALYHIYSEHYKKCTFVLDLTTILVIISKIACNLRLVSWAFSLETFFVWSPQWIYIFPLPRSSISACLDNTRPKPS